MSMWLPLVTTLINLVALLITLWLGLYPGHPQFSLV